MAVLLACSAFFSASEAALFYLRHDDRKALRDGNRSQQIAAALLDHPDRLLSAVLFWNLVLNMAYFAIASMVGLRLDRAANVNASLAPTFAVAALVAIIFFGEMAPKSVAVLWAKGLAGMVGAPLALAVRAVDPVMPALRLANLLSLRLVWPGFRAEPYLEAADLERAIDLSTEDRQIADQERFVLNNIVQLSETRIDELMRPRTQFRTFRPPISWDDLRGDEPPSGYVLVTERDSEDVDSAILLSRLFDASQDHFEHYGEPVLVTPWCATAAQVLQRMKELERRVAAVVNEYGETVGIVTYEDLIDSIFGRESGQGKLRRQFVEAVADDTWRVYGLASIRRLARRFHVKIPSSKSATVAGVVQEQLQRLPVVGDRCIFGPFYFHVVEAPRRGPMTIELKLRSAAEEGS